MNCEFQRVSPTHVQCVNPGCEYTVEWSEARGPVTFRRAGCAGTRATKRDRALPIVGTGECAYRGPERRRESCDSCTGNVQIKVFECAVHDECTIGKQLPGLHCCRGCPQWTNPALITIGQEPLVPVTNLAVVSCFYDFKKNPVWLENYLRFADAVHNAGVPLFTVELALDDDPFQVEDALHLRGQSEHHLMFQKERLYNIAIGRLPEQYDAVAWMDADVMLLNRDWPQATLDELSRRCVVQMFEDSWQLHPDGRLEKFHQSTGHRFQLTGKHSGHPGLAWAGRRDWLSEVGLLDYPVTTGGDLIMAGVFTGVPDRMTISMKPAFRSAVDEWGRKADALVKRRYGAVPGHALHLWHGPLKERLYGERTRALVDNDFDPKTDIEIDESGLYAWTDHARTHNPQMILEVARLFGKRAVHQEPQSV